MAHFFIFRCPLGLAPTITQAQLITQTRKTSIFIFVKTNRVPTTAGMDTGWLPIPLYTDTRTKAVSAALLPAPSLYLLGLQLLLLLLWQALSPMSSNAGPSSSAKSPSTKQRPSGLSFRNIPSMNTFTSYWKLNLILDDSCTGGWIVIRSQWLPGRETESNKEVHKVYTSQRQDELCNIVSINQQQCMDRKKSTSTLKRLRRAIIEWKGMK